MKTKYLLLTSLFMSTALYGQSDGQDQNVTSLKALQDWLDSKGRVSLKELGGSLSISGEVRGEFQANSEKIAGEQIRGRQNVEGKKNPPALVFDAEFNLMLDYRTDNSWASVKVEMDNDAGIFNGSSDRIRLERAVFGFQAFKNDQSTFDIELGRRALGSIFDSKVIFNSTFDGILLKYDRGFESIGDMYVRAGSFITDEKAKHYGAVAEIGYLNIFETGIFAKYSLINWKKNYSKHTDKKNTKSDLAQIQKIRNREFDAFISHAIIGYKCNPSWLGNRLLMFYGAAFANHKAESIAVGDALSNTLIVQQTHDDLKANKTKKANVGGYIGLSLGQMRKQWDWAADINYQIVGAQSTPSFDVSGIGLGTTEKNYFFSKDKDREFPTTLREAEGNTNYHGVSLKFDILLTDNIALTQSFMASKKLDKAFGRSHTYRQYEMEFIYSF